METWVLRLAASILLLTGDSSGLYTQIYDETNTTPFVNGPELALRMTLGARVVRGKDWQYGNQDGGIGGKGTVIRSVLDSWIRVEWDAGEINSYRMGSDGKYDLYLVDDHSSTNNTSTSGSSGYDIALRMLVGVRVVRGKDWKYGNQDGGIRGEGTVVRGLLDGWIRVEWDAGEINSYRMGNDGKYELDLAVYHPSTPKTITSTPLVEETTASVGVPSAPTGPELALRMKVGVRVVRGKDWRYGNQDGGIGSEGTVIRELLDGWVRVQWDAGEINSYRMGRDGKYELLLAADHPSTPNTDSTPIVTETTGSVVVPSALSGPELALRMVFSTRVVRGKDWQYGNQDGGIGSEGTVIRELLDGWVRVEWDAGEVNSYRMGSDGKYELNLVDDRPSTQRTNTTVPSATSDAELALGMIVGVRVVRGKDWKYGNQGGGNGGEGTVVRSLLDGWTRVEWDAGEINSYRMGSDGKYELYLAASEETTDSVDIESAATGFTEANTVAEPTRAE